MKKVFISYRREDSEHQTGRMYDRLSDHFGEENIFYDVYSIDAGVNWKERIRDRIQNSDVMITPIGDRWLEEFVARNDDQDALLFEIEHAQASALPIIPVLVGRGPMPTEAQLPRRIDTLHELNALKVRPGRDFHPDMDELIKAIERTKKARKIPRSEDEMYVSLAHGQEQLAKLAEWGWYTDPDLHKRIQNVLDTLIGTQAEQQLALARQVWRESGFAKTESGAHWRVLSCEFESGPGRDVHKRCLAVYVVGGSIEALGLYSYIGDFFGFSDVSNPEPIAVAGTSRLDLEEVTEVG